MDSTLTTTLILVFGLIGQTILAQDTGTIEGRVILEESGEPVHQASVMLVQLGRVTETDEDGRYFFRDVPPGDHDLVAYGASVTSEIHPLQLTGGKTHTVNLELRISPIKHEITVTAKGRQETAFEAVQSVTTLDTFDLAEKMAPSIGEVLEEELGLAKRSFGPGSARPVIRGFDGDRVLVMQDGIRVGALGSQSGDHGEPIDPSNLERLEVVKGPATLLYGSNAIGGVVNAISGHHHVHQQPHRGIRGRVSTAGGSNNGLAAGNANLEYGQGKWIFWAGGGGQRTGDYETPQGPVENSKTRINNGSAGFGRYGNKVFVSLGYTFNDGRYGVPFAHGHEEDEEDHEHSAEEQGEDEFGSVDIDLQRHSVQFGGGIRHLGSFIEDFRLSLNFTDWRHRELEILQGDFEKEETTFDNEQFVYRGVFEQRRLGLLSGSFGFWGLHRNYDVSGEEALSPPVDQTALAVFGLEELNLEPVKLQFGGRLEHTGYKPQESFLRRPEHRRRGEEETMELVSLSDRDFTGFSGGAGARVRLGKQGAFVANFTRSYRAPALEELYNFGPHTGLLAFEVGNPELSRERSNGLDLSLRHAGKRARGEFNLFYYDINDFVFLARTGEVRDGLLEGVYLQSDSRFIGSEFRLSLGLHDAVWVNLTARG